MFCISNNVERQAKIKVFPLIIQTCNFFIAAKDKGEKKLFGFAFTPLMRDDGTTLSDDIHELYVYKVPQFITNHIILSLIVTCHLFIPYSTVILLG